MIKKFLAFSLLALTLVGCANNPYYQQHPVATSAVGGAAIGALAGQLIGRDTKGTLVGAALGGLAGAAIGSANENNYYRNGYYY